jgi:hypothetical protein
LKCRRVNPSAFLFSVSILLVVAFLI